MGKLYITRHGQTDLNVKNLTCGITDAKLTQQGIEQAKNLAKDLSKYGIDIIITSPLLRAKETAQILASNIRNSHHNRGKIERAKLWCIRSNAL